MARLEGRFLGLDGRSLLLAAVVVEHGRPIHALLLATVRGDETAVHLWPPMPVERTDAVKRLVAQIAQELAAFGAGEIHTTNIPHLFPT